MGVYKKSRYVKAMRLTFVQFVFVIKLPSSLVLQKKWTVWKRTQFSGLEKLLKESERYLSEKPVTNRKFHSMISMCSSLPRQCPSRVPKGSSRIRSSWGASAGRGVVLESCSASASRRQWAFSRAGRRRTTSPPSDVLPGFSVATLDRYINIVAATVTMIGYVTTSSARWVLGQWKLSHKNV